MKTFSPLPVSRIPVLVERLPEAVRHFRTSDDAGARRKGEARMSRFLTALLHSLSAWAA